MIVINQSVSECEEGEKDKHANGNLQLPVVSKSNGELSPFFFFLKLFCIMFLISVFIRLQYNHCIELSLTN